MAIFLTIFLQCGMEIYSHSPFTMGVCVARHALSVLADLSRFYSLGPIGYTKVSSSEITSKLSERLKHTLIPGGTYIRYRVAKEMRRGERELALLPRLVDPRGNAIDIGANKGGYTYVLSPCYGFGCALAFHLGHCRRSAR